MAEPLAKDIVDVIIIGAGISGMTAAIDMIRLSNNRSFVIFEKGHRVGGTWSDNEYPGCCCDVWSHLYSLSFCPNPDWSREYPTQPEIQRYLSSVATEYNLEPHIRFKTATDACSFDPALGIWTVTTHRVDGGPAKTARSRFVIAATGQLSLPNFPKLAGLDGFPGPVIHSARWDKQLELSGKKIAIIGNGATAIQLIPELAKVAKKLVVFQRSPNWIVPRDDKTISPVRRLVYRNFPSIRSRYRASLMDFRETQWKVLVDTDGEEHHTIKKLGSGILQTQLPGDENSELRQKLTPDYPPGCKRILISDDYYPALGQKNVILELAPIERVSNKGICIGAGWNSATGQHEFLEHEFDVIVCATGFQATQFLAPIQVDVAGGASLASQWKSGAYAYKGMTVPDIPNFAIMFGPNTNLGHNSIILMIEAQSAYINRLIQAIRAHPGPPGGRHLSISPRDSVTKTWNARMQEELGKTTLASDKCTSWYKSETGLITTNWTGTVIDYQREVNRLDWDDYELHGSGASQLRAKGPICWERVKEESQSTPAQVSRLSSERLLLGAAAAAMVVFLTRRMNAIQ